MAPLSDFFFRFTYFRERDRERAWDGAEGEGQNPKQAPRLVAESNVGLSHDPDIKTWVEIKSWLPSWLRHPGAPSSLWLFQKNTDYLLHLFNFMAIHEDWRYDGMIKRFLSTILYIYNYEI